MKTKYYAFNCPVHLKKYLENKYKIDKAGNVVLAKVSSLAVFIHFGLKTISYPSPKKIDNKLPFVKIKYFEETFSKFLPNDSDSLILEFIDRQFREELVTFVSGCHMQHGDEYTVFVWQFLERYGIVRDEDIQSETARKIYRDYLEKNLKSHQKHFSKMSANSATCPQIQ